MAASSASVALLVRIPASNALLLQSWEFSVYYTKYASFSRLVTRRNSRVIRIGLMLYTAALIRFLPELLGGSRLQDFNVGLTTIDQNLSSPSRFAFRRRENQLGHLKLNTRLAVRAGLNEDTRGSGGGEFLAGFLLGGAVFGTLAYVFASQIRRSLQYEDEYGFSRGRRPVYYDEGLERTRQTLNAKISQLNSAIDNVSSLLRGGKNENSEPVEADPEVEATI